MTRLFRVQHQAFSGQSSPFALRIPQRAGALTPDKQQQQQLLTTQSEVAPSFFSPSLVVFSGIF
jgi:hypothetical protein